jgi:hypothetical protein
MGLSARRRIEGDSRAMESEIMNPAPFMRALGGRDYGTGNVYEMRTYTYAPAAASVLPMRSEGPRS